MTFKTTKLVICLLIITVALKTYAQSEDHSTNNWIPTCCVNHVEHSNGYTLLTGSFEEVGQYTGNHVLLDTVQGNIIAEGLPKIYGNINAAISDGNGGWYLGGYFQFVDTVKVSSLVHINADQSVDRNWKPTLNGHVYCLALDGTTLYTGGEFSEINGQARNYIASFNTTTGQLNSWNPSANSIVEIIRPAGDLVYVGGLFSNIGGQDRNSVAALKSSDGTANTWAPALAANIGPAYTYAIEVDVNTNTVYLGGTFGTAGGESRQGLAQLRTDDEGTATAWNADLSNFGSIQDIVRTGNTLYVAGSFFSIKGETRQGIAAVSTLGTGSILSWDAQLNSSASVSDIEISGKSIYMTGDFNTVNFLDRDRLAALNLSNASVTDWTPKTNYSYVDVISSIGDKVFLGGGFTTVNAIPQKGISLFDQSTGKPWPFSFGLDGIAGDKINTIAVKDRTIYIGGKFTNINKQIRNNLAAFDLATGNLLPWNPSVTIFDGGSPEVITMKIKNELLYIGGNFDRVNAVTRPSLAAINLTTGIPNNWDPVIGSGGALGGSVNTIDIVGTKVYIGGSFSLVGGDKPRSNLAVVDATTGEVLPWAPASAGSVDKIQVAKNAAYVVGDFANGIGGGTRSRRIASLDLTTGLLTKWDPQFDGNVNDIVLSSKDIYVGGNFEGIFFNKTKLYRPGLASFLLATDSLNEWMPDIVAQDEGSPGTNSLSISPTTLFVGGSFALGIEGRTHYAEYDICDVKPVITFSGSMLSTTQYDSYQWYSNGQLIPGATNQTLEIQLYEYNTYSVEVVSLGCTGLSNVYEYTITNNESKKSDLIKVYPNPARDEFFVSVAEEASLTLIDMMGQNIKSTTLVKEQPNKIETDNLNAGAYIVYIHLNNNTYHYKLLKTK